jgi:chromosome segregation ATPase
VTSALKNLKRKNTSLEQECAHLATELSALNDVKSALEAKVKAQKDRESADKILDAENLKLVARIEKLKMRNLEGAEKLVELKRVCEHTINQLGLERKKRMRLEAKAAKMVQNLRQLTKVAQTIQPKPEEIKQNEILKQRLHDKRMKWRSTKSEMRQVLESLRQRRDDALEAAKNYQIQIEDRAGLISQLEAKVDRRNNTISEYEQELESSAEQQEAVISELNAARSTVSDLKGKCRILRDSLKEDMTSLAANKKKYEKQRDKRLRAKQDLKQIKVSFAEKLQRMREDMEKEANWKIKELNDVLKVKEEEIQSLEKDLESSKVEYNEALSNLRKAELELENEKKRNAAAREGFQNRFQAMQKLVGVVDPTSFTDYDV